MITPSRRFDRRAFLRGGVATAVVGGVSLLLPTAAKAATVNVRDYPFLAQGNGVTDDTAAIANAIGAAQPGGTVIIPPGNYFVSGTFNVQSGQTIQGGGMDATVLTRYNGSAQYPFSGKLFVMPDNSTLAGLTIQCGGLASQNQQAEVGVAGPYVTLRQVRVRAHKYMAFEVAGNNALLDRCEALGTAHLYEGPNILDQDGNVIFYHKQSDCSTYGVWVGPTDISNPNSGGAGSRVTGGRFTGMGTPALYTEYINGVTFDQNYVAGNHLQEIPVTGGQIACGWDSHGASIWSNTVENGAAGASGLEIGGFSPFVSSNQVHNNPRFGIISQKSNGAYVGYNVVSGYGVAPGIIMCTPGQYNSPGAFNYTVQNNNVI